MADASDVPMTQAPSLPVLPQLPKAILIACCHLVSSP